MKKTTRTAAEPPPKPQSPDVPAGSAVPVAEIPVTSRALVLPLHVGMVDLENLPRDAWPSPSPVELATVAAACGWSNQEGGAEKSMALLWRCAAVIHESRVSAANYLESIKSKADWTTANLREACGFKYQDLPNTISRSAFLECFKVSGRLKVAGKELRGWDLVNHWFGLPEGMRMTPADLKEWHASHKKGFDCARFTVDERWELLAVMVAKFNVWRRETARRNNPGAKNLKRG